MADCIFRPLCYSRLDVNLNHETDRPKDRIGEVGSRQVIDWIKQFLIREAGPGLKVAILGLKLPLLEISGKTVGKGTLSLKNLKFLLIASIFSVKTAT